MLIPRSCRKSHKLSPRGRESGVVAVEFIFLFPVILMLLVGIVEFGHLFYVRHTLTNASREGARAAVVYLGPDVVGAARTSWADSTAKATVNKYMQDTKFAGIWTVSDTPGSNTGDLFKVTVTAQGSLLLLDKFIPALKDVSVSAETTMKME